MPGLSPFDVIVMAIVAGLFVVILWTTVFVMLFGIQKRLDQLLLLLDERLPRRDG